jgi:hypothetical protein
MISMTGNRENDDGNDDIIGSACVKSAAKFAIMEPVLAVRWSFRVK